MKIDKIKVLFGMIVMVIGLVGCTSQSDLSKDDVKEIVNRLDKIVYEDTGNRYSVLQYINENISKIEDVEISSNMINTFIYSLYKNNEMYTSILNPLQSDLIEVEDKLDIKIIENSTLNKIPQEYKILKAFIEELDENYLKLVKSNESYYVDVDLNKLKEDYSKYMNADTKDYVDFRIKENNLDIYNLNSDEYDIELILNTMNEVCMKIENLEGISQKENWVQHLYYYLEIVFSRNQTTFLGDEGKMLDDKFNLLKSESLKYSESNFGKLLNKYLEVLESSNKDVNSEEVNNYIEGVYNKLDSFLVDNK